MQKKKKKAMICHDCDELKIMNDLLDITMKKIKANNSKACLT